jgi:hypothetical protein
MALQIINLGKIASHFRQRTALDGREYILDFRWSQREGRWYLDLSDSSGARLASSIKLVVHQPLLKRLRSIPGLPPGELLLLDSRPTPAAPGLEELGAVDSLIYVEAAA